MKPPTVEDIDRIARLNDPILRNLQITQSYHELSESEVITEFDDPSLVEHKSPSTGTRSERRIPQSLVQIQNPCLGVLLAEVDLTPESLNATTAKDWANFKERMHFIADFFRVYQERESLFDAPFTPGQLEVLKMGERPEGRL